MYFLKSYASLNYVVAGSGHVLLQQYLQHACLQISSSKIKQIISTTNFQIRKHQKYKGKNRTIQQKHNKFLR